MKQSSIYTLQFSGLKLGEHFFEFDLENTFFDSCDSFGILGGTGKIIARLEKKETMMLLSLNLKTEVNVLCDRCNEMTRLMVNGNLELIYKFGEEDSLDETLIVLPYDSFQIDLFQPSYELFIVSLPSRFLHENDACDPEIIKYLSNPNESKTENQSKDPRWSELDKLN